MQSEPSRPIKVFLSYAHADGRLVRAFHKRLIADGVDSWLDKEKIIPGQDWEREIRKAVREADVVVVCLSKQFNQRGFRQKEVRIALEEAEMMPEGEIYIIPARLEECETPDSLRKWHWVDLFEEDGYTKLIRSLHVRAQNIGAELQPSKSGISNVFKKPFTQRQKKTKFEIPHEPQRKPTARKKKRKSIKTEHVVAFIGAIGIIAGILSSPFIIKKVLVTPPTPTITITSPPISTVATPSITITSPPISTVATHIQTFTPVPTKTSTLTPSRTPVPIVIWEDSFSENTLSKYVITGSVTWSAGGGFLMLGSGMPTENSKVYFYNDNRQSIIVQGKVFLPPRSYYYFESVAIGLKNDKDEYWATLLFGNTGDSDNKLAILENDKWVSNEYKMNFETGWYWIKVFVDYENHLLRMKAWKDNETEPGWQVSQTFSSTWRAEQIGFRHFGAGVYVDNLLVETIR
jgi:hypothetical protein